MDPNEALRMIRRIVDERNRVGATGDEGLSKWEIETFFDHVEALDEWMSKGGFLPDSWRDARGGAGEGPVG